MEIRFGEITSNDLNEIRKLQPEGWTDIMPEYELYVRKKFCFPLKYFLDKRACTIKPHLIKCYLQPDQIIF